MKLYNDDCLNVLKTIETESVDCVVTDCPYHIVSGGCSNDKVTFGRYNTCGEILDKRGTNASHTYIKQGKIFEHNDIEFKDWLPEVYRVLKPNTHCYVMINARNVKELQESAEEVGFAFQNLIVWDKGNSVPNKYYMNSYELILMLRKGKARNINKMGTSNILRVPNIIRNKKHPTEKPFELMQILVENSTNKGDIVLDPFMGVGGVGIACKKTGRGFIGIEIDNRYFQIAKNQINRQSAEMDTIYEIEQMTLF